LSRGIRYCFGKRKSEKGPEKGETAGSRIKERNPFCRGVLGKERGQNAGGEKTTTKNREMCNNLPFARKSKWGGGNYVAIRGGGGISGKEKGQPFRRLEKEPGKRPRKNYFHPRKGVPPEEIISRMKKKGRKASKGGEGDTSEEGSRKKTIKNHEGGGGGG